MLKRTLLNLRVFPQTGLWILAVNFTPVFVYQKEKFIRSRVEFEAVNLQQIGIIWDGQSLLNACHIILR